MERRMKKAIKNEKQSTDKLVQRIMRMCMENLKEQEQFEPELETINVAERFKAKANYLERVKSNKELPLGGLSTNRSSRSVARGV